MTRALITCHHLQRNFDGFLAEFEANGIEPFLPEIQGQQFNSAEMCAHIVGSDVIIAGDDVIDAPVLEAARKNGVKAVIRWGIGTDSVDKQAAARLGVPVYNTPGVFSDEVADMALSHLLMLTRQLHKMHQSVLDGGWRQISGRTLNGMTVGVVGLGSVGLGIVRRCNAVGMRVLGCDVRQLGSARQKEESVVQLGFEELLDQSDVVILACSLSSDNRHMMNAEAFARMARGSYIINVGRGPLVDEKALVAALENGHLAGAGLDVFEEEPLPAGSSLRKFDNCVFGTHSGSNTAEAVDRINRMTVDILLHMLAAKKIDFTPNRVA